MSYELQLDSFQGPLEVLYQLVKKNKIEISEISLASIAEQYLEYIENLNVINLDLASEFMIIAAELMELKIRTLLPQEEKRNEEEKEDENNLVKRLQEYDYFKKASMILQEYEEKGIRFHQRAVDIGDFIGEEIEVNLDLELTDLKKAFRDVLISFKTRKTGEEQEEEKEWKSLRIEDIRIEDRIAFITSRLKNAPGGLSFAELIMEKENKLEIVVTFLGVLELARMSRIRIKQDKVFSKIIID